MFQNLLNLFFPKACCGCNSFLQSTENVICTKCRHEIPLTNHHSNEENEVMSRFYGRIPLEHASTLFYFHKKGIVQEMIHKLKYKGHQEVGETIGFWFGEELKNVEKLKDVDFIIPVPLHKRRLRTRGFNQVTKFGEALSSTLEIPFIETILQRNIYSETQVRKNIFQRSDVTERIFSTNFTEEMHNKHFLLIDDVITTGATLESCGRELLKIPGAKLSVVCMAMTQ